MNINNLIGAVLAFVAFTSFAQKIGINGIIISETQEPISYAHVYSKSLQSGTFTNEKGEFRFVMDSTTFPLELSISHIGYQLKTIQYAERASDITITLHQSTMELSEVSVTGLSALQVIQRALQVLDSSIANNAIYVTSFVREKLTKVDSLVYTAEVLTKSYSVPYFDFISDNQVTVLKGRYDSSIPDSLIHTYPKVVNGVYSSIGLDIIRKRTDFLRPKRMHKYRFAYKENLVSDGKRYLCIEYSTATGKYSGLIILDADNFTILRIEMSLTSLGLISFNSRNMNVRSFKLVCEYIYVEEKGIFLKMARLKSQIVWHDEAFFLDLICVSSKFQFDNVRPFLSEDIATSKSLKRELIGKEIDNFWKDQNVILWETIGSIK